MQQRNTEGNSQSIEEKIIDDLRKSGFASEIFAEAIFFSKDWDTTAGNYYFDLDENKVREYDVHAFKAFYHKDDDFTYTFRVNLIGEVKKSRNPWVVIKKHDEVIDAWQNLIEHRNLPGKTDQYTRLMTKYSVLHDCEGSAIHESFKDPSSASRWYSAIINAIKASEDVIKTGGILEEAIRNSAGEPLLYSDRDSDSYLMMHRVISMELVRPVIILDGLLFSAQADGDDIEVERIKWSGFNINFGSPKYTRGSYRVDIVTLDSLEEYIQLFEGMGRDIQKYMVSATKSARKRKRR